MNRTDPPIGQVLTQIFGWIWIGVVAVVFLIISIIASI